MKAIERTDKKIGMILPSSNTVVEPMVSRVLANIEGVSVHYSRFTVKEISANEDAKKQFELETMLAAVQLLVDAEVDLIVYAATSGAWLGLETDRDFCAAVEERFGIRATTSILSLLDGLRRMQVSSYGLVAGYSKDLVARVIANFGDEGFECLGWRSFFITENKQLSLISELSIKEKVEEIIPLLPDAIITLGTNVRAAVISAEIEQRNNIVVIDTILVTVWKSMQLLEIPTHQLKQWGKLFVHEGF